LIKKYKNKNQATVELHTESIQPETIAVILKQNKTT